MWLTPPLPPFIHSLRSRFGALGLFSRVKVVFFHLMLGFDGEKQGRARKLPHRFRFLQRSIKKNEKKSKMSTTFGEEIQQTRTRRSRTFSPKARRSRPFLFWHNLFLFLSFFYSTPWFTGAALTEERCYTEAGEKMKRSRGLLCAMERWSSGGVEQWSSGLDTSRFSSQTDGGA